MIKRVEKLTAEELKSANPSLYDEVVNVGKAESAAKIVELEAAISEIEKSEAKKIEQELIKATAKKLGLEARGDELVSQDVSVTEALATLAKESLPVIPKSAFAATASEIVGNGKADADEVVSDVKTQEQAMHFCMKKYGCSKKEAWHKAKVDFANLFNGIFNNSKGE